MAAFCKFGALHGDLIRDRIVCGIQHNSVRKKLLQETKLTLKKCLDISRAAESTSAQLKTMAGQAAAEANVHCVQKRGKPKPKPKPKGQKGPDVNYKYCAKNDEKPKKKCPAFGKTCSKCSKPNNFATVCQSKAKQVNQLEAEDEDSSTEEVLVADNKALSKIFVTMLVNITPPPVPNRQRRHL